MIKPLKFNLIEDTNIHQPSFPKWNWNKSSKAVVAIGKCGTVVILHGAGPVFGEWASEVGFNTIDMGMDNYDGEGIYIWEGNLFSSRSWEGDYDCEIDGEIRDPTDEEWEYIRQHDSPWSHRDWLLNPCEVPDCEYPREDGYPVCDEHREEIEKGKLV
jgi:hypothetical protein